MRDTYGIEFSAPIGGSMVAEIEARLRPPVPSVVRAPPPESWLSSVCLNWHIDPLEPFQQYMLDRGLSRETLAEFDCGYDFLSNRVTIPIRALDGSLFGVKGRDWEGTHPAKYLPCGERPGAQRLRYGFSTYEITEVVFGLHRARDVRWTVLHEGEINAMATWQLGVPRPTALGTSGMSERQRRLIVDEVEEVYVSLDVGAEDHAREIAERLEPYVRVKVVQPLDVDPCDALRDGRGDEVLRAIDEAKSSVALSGLFG